MTHNELAARIERAEGPDRALDAGRRVVLTKYGREYATVAGDGSRPESIMLNVDGRYYNPQEHWRSDVVPAIAPRDMVIGDLLNLQMLKDAIEQPFLGSLWTHGDSGMLTPYVCECSFGDGMRLLCVRTINQRPNYHVVRVHSGWDESNWSPDDNVGEHIDEIISAIEEECGEKYAVDEECAECDGYPCHCNGGESWPAIDADTGCSWSLQGLDWIAPKIGYDMSATALRARSASDVSR